MFDLANLSLEVAMDYTRAWHYHRRRLGLPFRPAPYGRALRLWGRL